MACILIMAAALAAVPASGQDADNSPFSSTAKNLSNSLFGEDFCATHESRTVGIWPFDPERIPISMPAAERIYTEVLSLLISRKPDCVDYLDGAGVGAVISHLNRIGALQRAAGNPLAALSDANERVDIVMFGSIIVQDSRPFLAVKAVERETGRTLAQTQPANIPVSYLKSRPGDLAQGLDTAIAIAARYFVDVAANMRELVPVGVYYEESGAQPAFGRYITERLSTALVREFANVVTGATLRVREPRHDYHERRGLAVEAKDLEHFAEADDQDATGTFELIGRYWIVDNTIDLKLSLRNASNDTVSWQWSIRRNDLPEKLALRPQNESLPVHEGTAGILPLQITSPHGPNPVYAPGEEMNLFVRVGQDAWLYCFYVDAAGSIKQVLPNRFQRGTKSGNFLAGGLLHEFPDTQSDPFTFRFNETTLGEEIVKCFATSRDVTSELPAALQGTNFDPLPLSLATRLSETFWSLPKLTMGESSLTVTVAAATPSFKPGEEFQDCDSCPRMVVVPAGEFMMGSPASEKHRGDSEGPQHRVSIAAPFAVGKYEVTRGEFGAFVAATSYDTGQDNCFNLVNDRWKKLAGMSWRKVVFEQTDRHPVVCVSAHDAKAYVKWLSETTGQNYRLLSEAEWEYAARAGTSTRRPWGNDNADEEACAYANGADKTAKAELKPNWTVFNCTDCYVFTAPVGSFEANGFQLHDMLGNVMEWVADCRNDTYDGAPQDGSANTGGNCSRGVPRGGSWIMGPQFLRSASRGSFTTTTHITDIGFRVGRVLNP